MKTKTHQSKSTEKIAILGGGIAALTTAFYLTESNKNYDITVYQIGWQLGGKGASGRNMDPDYGNRIEEHGLHIWSGSYDNAFRIIRKCYAELNRPPDAPLATWQDAFKPHNNLVLMEYYKGEWLPWPLELPTNNNLPGETETNLYLPLWSYIGYALQLMRTLLKDILQETQISPSQFSPPTDKTFIRLIYRLNKLLNKPISNGLEHAITWGDSLLETAYNLSQSLYNDQGQVVSGIAKNLRGLSRLFGSQVAQLNQQLILKILATFMQWLWQGIKNQLDHKIIRRSWISLNLTYGHIRGIFEDNLIEKGLDSIDDQDYKTWLQKYIIDDTIDDYPLTLNAPLANFLYTADFAYKDGDLNQPDLSASSALYALLRMAFTTKGAFIWKMQAGMGDVVFTPLYQVLKQRGVKFKFFHRVKQLYLDPKGRYIKRISIGQQVNLKAEYKQQGYNPLIQINGLDCWPSTPLYDQIEGGEALKQNNINLLAPTTKDVAELTLEFGKDFNQVVLGIPIAVLPSICSELIEANSKWAAMVKHVKTVATHALQLWLKPTTAELGWQDLPQPLLGTYKATPLDTWCDMSHLINQENWPAVNGAYPLNISYFCGPLQHKQPPTTSEKDKKAAKETVEKNVLDLLENHISVLWPNIASKTNNIEFNWDLLIDNRSNSAQGQTRLESQFIKVNTQPTERYTLALSGSGRYRLEPNNSGFANLYLAGDWTKNSFNAGCIEAAVISGMLAAYGLSGYPTRNKIIGLDFGIGYDNV